MNFLELAVLEGKDISKYVTIVSRYVKFGAEQMPYEENEAEITKQAKKVCAFAPRVFATNLKDEREYGVLVSLKYTKDTLEEILIHPDTDQEIRGIQKALSSEPDLQVLASTKNYVSFTIPTLREKYRFPEIASPDLGTFLASSFKSKNRSLEHVKVRIVSQNMRNYILEPDMNKKYRDVALKTLAGLRITTKGKTPMVINHRPMSFDKDGEIIRSGFDVQPFYAPINGIYVTGSDTNQLEILASANWPIKMTPYEGSPLLHVHKPWIEIAYRQDEKGHYNYPDDSNPELITTMLENLPFDADAEGIHLKVGYGERNGFISTIHVDSDAPIPIHGMKKTGIKYDNLGDGITFQHVYTTPERIGIEVNYWLKRVKIKS